jgi:lipopolysaccharide transport system ATP-binding protein
VGPLAIKAVGLGKRYALGRKDRHMRFDTLREWLAGAWQRRARDGGDNDGRTIWALREVNFEVAVGEVVGMIGHNGAGKSTLLKILSRITEPTEGLAEIEGRVGSLLDVGTGFHPELTGRENIFLNGAILGMKRADIARKFDEIVSFAETETFLDTPVKWYSSGMYMRLAFAVAAHLEPDILIIDEILGVGDAAFQRKGLGKVGDFAKQGRTVLFVSHNLGAVRSLCSRALVFDGGRVQFDGATDAAISYYLANTAERLGENDGLVRFARADGGQQPDLALREIRLLDAMGQVRGVFDSGEPIRVEIEYEVQIRLRGARTTLQVSTQEGEKAFVSTDHLGRDPEQLPGRYRTACTIPGGLLNQRMYMVGVGFDIPGIRSLVAREDRLAFMVSGGGNHGSTYPEDWPGVVCPVLDWKTETI